MPKAPERSEPPTTPLAEGLTTNRLGAIAIAFFVIAAAAPIGAVVGSSPVLFAASGAGTPVVYTIAALFIALFSVGYLRMSREITSAAGFVAYIAKGLGPRWAAGSAGIAVLTYLCLQSGLWSQFGVFARQLLVGLGGPSLPVPVWILAGLLLTTVLTMRGVDASFKVLGVLIAGETAVIVLLLVFLIANHGWVVFSVSGFTAQNVFGPGLGVSLLFAFTCFTCFEATVVFSEEAIRPRKTIPRALYLVIAFVGLFYAVSTWAISGVIGAEHIRSRASEDPAGLIFGLAADNAGAWLSTAMQVMVVTSFLAMLLGLSNMFSRYIFALGRAGALPRHLASISRTGSPAVAATANGSAVAVVVCLFFLAGADPITTVYAWLVALGTAGFITILLLASVAIVVHFARQGGGGCRWSTVVAPVLSTLAFTMIGYLAVDNYDALLGGAGATAKWLLVLIPGSFAAGLLLTARRPDLNYESPGL